MFIINFLNDCTDITSSIYKSCTGVELTKNQARVAALATTFFAISLAFTAGATKMYLKGQLLKIAAKITRPSHYLSLANTAESTASYIFKATIYPVAAGTATTLVFATMRVIHPNYNSKA